MNTRTANYCLKQGFVNIKRNKLFSLASIGTIAACTFLIGVIFTIIINVNFMEKKVEQQVGVTIQTGHLAVEHVAQAGERKTEQSVFCKTLEGENHAHGCGSQSQICQYNRVAVKSYHKI